MVVIAARDVLIVLFDGVQSLAGRIGLLSYSRHVDKGPGHRGINAAIEELKQGLIYDLATSAERWPPAADLVRK